MMSKSATHLPAALESFRLPAFRLLFYNGVLASVSMNVTGLVHSWLVLSLSDDSPFWVGVSVAMHGVGQVAFAVLGGVVVDRYDRRLVLFCEQLSAAAVAGVLAVTSYLGWANLPLAIGLSFVMGANGTLERTASNAILYDVAGQERLLNALSLRRVAVLPGMIGGSLVAGWVLATVGTWSGYALICGALILAPWVLLRLPAPARPGHERAGVLHQALEGVRYGAKDWQVRTLLLVALGMESFGFSYMTMIPVMAKNVLDVGPVGLGFISAATGVGSTVAVLAVAALGDLRHKPRLILGTAAAAGVFLVGFSFSRSLPLAMLFAMLTTACLMAYDITIGALLQLVAPPAMRGRIVSLHSLAIAFMSLGGFLTGALGSVIGVNVMMMFGGGAILTNLLAQRGRLMRIREPAFRWTKGDSLA